MTRALPDYSLQLTSTLSGDGTLTIALTEQPISPPGPGEVLIQIASGTHVVKVGEKDEWTQVTFTVSTGAMTGWVATKFLQPA